MPTETRRLVFTSDELKEALTRYSQTGTQALPRGQVVGCDLKGERGVQAVVAVSDPGSGEVRKVDLDATQLGACLIKFCLDNKIPLPRDGTKSLQVVGDDIALRITRGLREEGLAG